MHEKTMANTREEEISSEPATAGAYLSKDRHEHIANICPIYIATQHPCSGLARLPNAI